MGGLPGKRHPLPDDAMCDCHPDRPAVANVQGETDSMGYETILMCRECLEADRAYEASDEARSGRCDWCRADVTGLVWARCYDEGLDGPTYRVCAACKKRQTDRLQAEMDEHDDWDWSEPDDLWDPPDDRDPASGIVAAPAGETAGLDPQTQAPTRRETPTPAPTQDGEASR